MILSNDTIDLGWCRLRLEVTDAITDEVFVWVSDVRQPTKNDLRLARTYAEAADPRFYIYVNIDASNETHLRIAHFFGFREHSRRNGISIQVWEKDKCKLLCSH